MMSRNKRLNCGPYSPTVGILLESAFLMPFSSSQTTASTFQNTNVDHSWSICCVARHRFDSRFLRNKRGKTRTTVEPKELEYCNPFTDSLTFQQCWPSSCYRSKAVKKKIQHRLTAREHNSPSSMAHQREHQFLRYAARQSLPGE